MRNSTDRIIELLSPAKNMQYGIEAIKAGADSVYIASEKFGLRKRFSNSLEDIKKLCEFAHKYWAKVYVTINSTIYSDDDFKYVQDTIYKLYNEVGVDAVIFSDMGILTLDLPPIPLYASVNTRCFTADKIKFMEDIGVKRIILPRELTFDEIKNIAEKTTIPLEVFIHGTFCVAYSGNCYFKYAQSLKRTQGKKELRHYQNFSSNNGSCIANCTDIYNLLDADGNYIVKNDHLLGLRYLNLIEEIDKLIAVGVHSFKIEGRQRELSYVKNITAYCNQKMNEILERNNINLKRLSSGTSTVDFKPDLDKTYNRSFTNYFFYGRKKENLSIKEAFGTYVGKAVTLSQNYFKLDNNDFILNIGDKILCQKDKESTFTINIIEAKDGIYRFDNDNIDISEHYLYRVLNAKVVEEIDNAKLYRCISAEIRVEKLNDVYNFSITDEDNITACVIYKPIIKNEITKVKFISLLEDKNGEVKVTKIICDDILNINEKDIKLIKEKLFSALFQEREKLRPKDTGYINKKSTLKYPEAINYLDNVNNSKAVEFYKQHGINNPELGLEHSKNIADKQIYTGKYCIKYELGYCSKLKNPDIPKLPWYLEDKYNNKYKIVFDCSQCEMHILY